MIDRPQVIVDPEALTFQRSVRTRHILAEYEASLVDALVPTGRIVATVTPVMDTFEQPAVTGVTVADRFESAIADALATEFTDTRQGTIEGWTLGSPDVSPVDVIYEAEMFIPESAEDERAVLDSYASQLPYGVDVSEYSLYRFTNSNTGNVIQSFVHRIADDELPEMNGKWVVESSLLGEDDENDDTDDTSGAEAMK